MRQWQILTTSAGMVGCHLVAVEWFLFFTTKAADYRAKRVTGSVFAAAQKAAKSMIEEMLWDGSQCC